MRWSLSLKIWTPQTVLHPFRLLLCPKSLQQQPQVGVLVERRLLSHTSKFWSTCNLSTAHFFLATSVQVCKTTSNKGSCKHDSILVQCNINVSKPNALSIRFKFLKLRRSSRPVKSWRFFKDSFKNLQELCIIVKESLRILKGKSVSLKEILKKRIIFWVTFGEGSITGLFKQALRFASIPKNS